MSYYTATYRISSACIFFFLLPTRNITTGETKDQSQSLQMNTVAFTSCDPSKWLRDYIRMVLWFVLYRNTKVSLSSCTGSCWRIFSSLEKHATNLHRITPLGAALCDVKIGGHMANPASMAASLTGVFSALISATLMTQQMMEFLLETQSDFDLREETSRVAK